MIRLLSALLAFCAIPLPLAKDDCSSSDDRRPNILFIMLDSLGWGDLSATSSKIATPNLDQLFKNSVRLNRHYVHLMGSPSRTQFLTGRYAMNLGFGEFNSWYQFSSNSNNVHFNQHLCVHYKRDDSVIGGIPAGQPTLANWLRDFGEYTTYAVGKWHLGYANRALLPQNKGFTHFYGFYQGAIDYVSKKYNFNGRLVHDFWEDGEPSLDAVESEELTMELYSQKIQEYFEIEGGKYYAAESNGETSKPFYLLASLQAMHTPFPEIDKYSEQCHETIKGDKGEASYIAQREKYCGLLMLTDRVIGDIMGSIRANHLWDDTLVVLTAVEGGEITRGASNYPLRGTQGEYHDGNNRVLTAVSGGVINELNLFGEVRDQIFSNLDWTPTLLDFAGYLNCINPDEVTWDGISQKRMILGSVTYDEETESRKQLVLNIDDKFLKSAALLMNVDGTLYKYIKVDNSMKSDDWLSFWEHGSLDSWSSVSDEGDLEVKVWADHYAEEGCRYSQWVQDTYLFNMDEDISEQYNLLNSEWSGYDERLNSKLLREADEILNEFLDGDSLWSPAISGLHAKMEQGDPGKSADGKFMRPFLNNEEYKSAIRKMFIDESGFHPAEQKALYLEQWHSPNEVFDSSSSSSDGIGLEEIYENEQDEEVEDDESSSNDQLQTEPESEPEVESLPDPEPEPESLPQSESESASVPEESEPDSEPEIEPQPQPQPQPMPEPDPEQEPEPKAVSDSESMSQSESKSESQVESESEMESESELEMEPDPQPEPEQNSDKNTESESVNEQPANPEPEANAEPQSEPEEQTNSDSESETVEESISEDQEVSQTQAEPETEPESESQQDSEAKTPPDAEPEPEPASEENPKAESEPQAEPEQEQEAQTPEEPEPETEPEAETETEPNSPTQTNQDPVSDSKEEPEQAPNAEPEPKSDPELERNSESDSQKEVEESMTESDDNREAVGIVDDSISESESIDEESEENEQSSDAAIPKSVDDVVDAADNESEDKTMKESDAMSDEVADGLADGDAHVPKTLKWWVILIIVVAALVIIISVVISAIKCYRTKKKKDEYRLITEQDSAPPQYSSFD